MGYLNELESKYQLTYGISTQHTDKLLDKVGELLEDAKLSETFQARREKMLNECDDVVQLWENYFIANKKK